MENEDETLDLDKLQFDMSMKLNLWENNRMTDLQIIEYIIDIDKQINDAILGNHPTDLSGLGYFNFEYGKFMGALVEKFGIRNIKETHKALKREDTIDNILDE